MSTSQAGYQETPYAPASWEIVGEPCKERDFVPLGLKVVPKKVIKVDPMFADFGGVAPESTKFLRHTSTSLSEDALAEEAAAKQVALEEQRKQELEQAYQRGLTEGRTEAASADAAQRAQALQEIRESITQTLSAMSSEQQRAFAQIERQAVDVAITLAKKLVGHAVEINPEYIIQLVKESLALAGSAEVRRVLVSPQDLEFIKVEGLEALFLDSGANWQFSADDAVTSGCRIETSAGVIDFELDKSFERISSKVLKAINNLT